MAKNFWLMKTEPRQYSIDDLKKDKRTCWEGVRNYQARNLMRDGMSIGDGALFYYSGSDSAEGEPGVAGVMRIASKAYADPHALDPTTCDYDAKATVESNPWLMIDVEFVEKFARFLPLKALRADKRLEGMALLQRGQRLSIQPVSKAHFDLICRMGRAG